MVNGVVVKVEGDPDSPISKGRLCPRGSAGVMNLYNPYRVKAPMKRTNPEKAVDNDPKWVEISWDEALNTVGEKLKACKAKDPRGLIVNESFGSKETRARTAFQQASGTPNMVGSHGPTCSVHYASNIVQGGGPVSTRTFSIPTTTSPRDAPAGPTLPCRRPAGASPPPWSAA